MIRSLSRLLSLSALFVSATGLILMTAIIGWQVFARYVLNSSPSWTEQAALYLMLWFILFAAAAGVREGFHIRISLLQDSVEGTVRRVLSLVCHAIVGLFGLSMVIGGSELVSATWSHTIPTLGLPRGSAYLPIAGAGALILFFAIEHILAELSGREVKPLWN
nr:TRAP transporter small permease [uncultured Hyphomonas sp.]